MERTDSLSNVHGGKKESFQRDEIPSGTTKNSKKRTKNVRNREGIAEQALLALTRSLKERALAHGEFVQLLESVSLRSVCCMGTFVVIVSDY